MLKEKSAFFLDVQKTIDIGLTGVSFVLAYFIKRHGLPGYFGGLSITPNYYTILLLSIISWFISFKWMGMYMPYRHSRFHVFFCAILKSCFTGTILLSIAMYTLHIQDVSRLLIGLFLLINICLLTLSKFIIYKTLKSFRSHGFNTRNALIVGSGTRAVKVINAIEENRSAGYRVLGCFDIGDEELGKTVCMGHKVIGLVQNLEQYMKDNIVDEIIFATSLKRIEKVDRYIAFAEGLGIKIRIIPDWELSSLMYQPGIATVEFGQFLGIQNMSVQTTPPHEGMMILKHIFDFSTAFILTLLLLPLFLLITVCIKIYSPGSAIYRQERLGMNGRRFVVYKFRTMVNHADEMLDDLRLMNEADGPAFKIKNDPRIIPYIGTFLRRTNLDELPQLFNVLKGEMSLVGPRPPIPSEVEDYSLWHRRRLSMKPGMTCLWQIMPRRNDLSFKEWIEMDLEYIDTWSFLNDFKILFLTAKSVLTGAGR